MRLIIYGSFLLLSCYIIQTSDAQKKTHKIKNGDDVNDSKEKFSKYRQDKRYKKYESKNDDSEEKYNLNKYNKQRCQGKKCNKNIVESSEEDVELSIEVKNAKYTRKTNRFEDDEDLPYKNNKRDKNKEYKKKYNSKYIDDKSEEDLVEEKEIITKKYRKNNNENEKDAKNKFDKKKGTHYENKDIEESRKSTDGSKNKKSAGKEIKDSGNDFNKDKEDKRVVLQNTLKHFRNIIDTDGDEDDSSEENENDFNRDKEDKRAVLKKTLKRFRKIIDTDNDEDDNDEEEDDLMQTCKKKGRRGKQCNTYEDENGSDEEINGNSRRKKIKYSIKFAHEKQKSAPSEGDNIMKKIHKENKRYKYQDDDDGSSEENVYPKRIRFAEEDDD